ncbi:MAG: PqqD family peptide modification chaperone [Planctomycetota bacterium]
MLTRLPRGQENALDPRATQPELVPDLVTRRSRGRVLFVHPTKPRWILLNDSAAELSLRFDGVQSIRAIAESVAADSRVAPDLVESDLRELAAVLYRRGFLVTEQDRQYKGKSFAISSVFLRVTDACNLRCTQCYADSFGPLKSKTGELTTGELRSLLEEIKALGAHTVTFSGGEPLLRPDMLELVEYAGETLGLRVKMNSNGTLLLAPGTIERLVPVLAELQVSFDGATAEIHDAVRGKGSFESSKRGIRAFLEAGGEHNLLLNMTLMRANIETAHDLPVLAKALGVGAVRYNTVVDDGRAAATWADEFRPTDEQFIAFYEGFYFDRKPVQGVLVKGGLQGFLPNIPEDFRDECMLCPVSLTPAIGPQGDVYPCSMFERPGTRVGSVREAGSLRAVVESGKLQQVRETLTRRPSQISECSQCDWRGLCQSGCAGSVDSHHGDVKHPDGFCEVRDHLYMRLIFDESGQGRDAGTCACVE